MRRQSDDLQSPLRSRRAKGFFCSLLGMYREDDGQVTLTAARVLLGKARAALAWTLWTQSGRRQRRR